jgi:hypothetical protein
MLSTRKASLRKVFRPRVPATIHDDAVEGGHGARAPFPRCGLDYTVPAIIRRSRA